MAGQFGLRNTRWPLAAALLVAATGADAAAAGATDVTAADSRCTNATAASSDMAAPLVGDRRARLSQALRKGIGIQYWGPDYNVPTLADAEHGVLVIEAVRIGAPHSASRREVYFSPEEVRAIRQDGDQIVLGYINISEIEPYRDYWSDAVRSAFSGTETPQTFAWYGPKSRSGEWLARYWTPEWEAVLLARVDRIMTHGYDGVLLDDVLHYYTFAAGLLKEGTLNPDGETPQDAQGYARAMMRLATRISERVRSHDCNALVVVNNGAYIGRDAGPDPDGQGGPSTFDTYRSSIDGIMMESLFAPNANPEAITVIREDFQASGIDVLTVDFASYFPDMAPDDVRSNISFKARENGFAPYVADNSGFDRLYKPIIDPE